MITRDKIHTEVTRAVEKVRDDAFFNLEDSTARAIPWIMALFDDYFDLLKGLRDIMTDRETQ